MWAAIIAGEEDLAPVILAPLWPVVFVRYIFAFAAAYRFANVFIDQALSLSK